MFASGKGRSVSLNAFFAHKIGWKTLDEDQLHGLFEFNAYMKTHDMADPKPISEWEEWYDAFFTEIENEEEAA